MSFAHHLQMFLLFLFYTGSEIDVQNLTNVFKEELQYQVECSSHDMTKLELQNYFRKISRAYLEENSKDYHSFICVIIGEGIEVLRSITKYISLSS